MNIPRTGRPGGAGGSSGGIGTLVTKTLVISGEGGTVTTPTGQRGAMLRAYDKATGAEVGAVYMPGAQTGSPMTYMLERQAVHRRRRRAARSLPGELIAYTTAMKSVRHAMPCTVRCRASVRVVLADASQLGRRSWLAAIDRYGDIEITHLIHSNVQLEHAGKVIQIDPWSVGDLSKAKPADLILITDDVGITSM